MPLDANGIWQYTGDEMAAPAPDLLNRLASSTSSRVATAIRQGVQPFASAAARTAQLPAPVEGMLSWLQDVNQLDVFNGTAWVAYLPGQTAWATYTPTMGGFTGTPTRARWIKTGGLIHAQIGITVTAVGAAMSIGLPANAAAAAVHATIPVGTAQGISSGTVTVAGAPFLASATTVQVRHTDTGTWDQARPFSWPSGSFLGLNLVYEGA